MASGPDYTILAADLLTGTIREEIPFDTFQYGRVLNAAGAFQGAISVRHPKATRENLDPSRTFLYVLRDGVCKWSGIHWTSLADVGQQDQLQVGGEGFFSYFAGAGGQTSQGRFLKADKSYTGVKIGKTYQGLDQLAIAQDVITWAQLQPGGDLGVIVGSETSGVKRFRTYLASERHNIGQIISDLAAVVGGFDFSFDTDFSSGSPVTTMHLWYPMQGNRTSGLVFELDAEMIETLQWSVDGTLQANSVDMVGQSTAAASQTGSAADTAALDSYPLLETVQQTKSGGTVDINDLTTQAQSYLATVDGPVETVSGMTIRVTDDIQPGAWTMGDWVTVRAHDGYIDIDDTFRITADLITVDAEGSEQVQLTLEQASTFA